MRYTVLALFVVTFFGWTRAASAQPQQIRVPYEVCAGTTQSQLCEALALLRQQQAAPTVVAPLSAPPAVAAAVRPSRPRCPSGSAGAECRCRNRGRLFQEGRCLSARSAITAVTGETRTLATRMTAAEAAIEQLRSNQTATDRRVSENSEATNCLQVILLPNVGVDPAAVRRMATEERAAELGRLHGAYCADFYRAAYNLPTPPSARMATVPTPPPPAPPQAPVNAHAPSPAPPPSADPPITVTFQ